MKMIFPNFDEHCWSIWLISFTSIYVAWPFDYCPKGGGQAENHFDMEVPSLQYPLAEKPGIQGPWEKVWYFCARLVCVFSFPSLVCCSSYTYDPPHPSLPEFEHLSSSFSLFRPLGIPWSGVWANIDLYINTSIFLIRLPLTAHIEISCLIFFARFPFNRRIDEQQLIIQRHTSPMPKLDRGISVNVEGCSVITCTLICLVEQMPISLSRKYYTYV